MSETRFAIRSVLCGVVSEVFDAADYPVAQLRVPLVIVAQSLLELGYPELSFVIYKLADYVQALRLRLSCRAYSAR